MLGGLTSGDQCCGECSQTAKRYVYIEPFWSFIVVALISVMKNRSAKESGADLVVSLLRL